MWAPPAENPDGTQGRFRRRGRKHLIKSYPDRHHQRAVHCRGANRRAGEVIYERHGNFGRRRGRSAPIDTTDHFADVMPEDLTVRPDPEFIGRLPVSPSVTNLDSSCWSRSVRAEERFGQAVHPAVRRWMAELEFTDDALEGRRPGDPRHRCPRPAGDEEVLLPVMADIRAATMSPAWSP